MSDYTRIQCKTQSESYGFGAEKVSTTLCLVHMGGAKVGLTYESEFSGIKSGQVSGGPIEVDGNIARDVNPDPKVTISVSGYENTGSHASMHVSITVAIPLPLVGTKTIYSQTLAGDYTPGVAGWAPVLEAVAGATVS